MNRRAFALLFVLVTSLVVIACSTSDPYDAPPRGGYGRGGGFRGGSPDGGGAMIGGAMLGGGLDALLAQSEWWRDPRIATAVNPTSDQVAALDKIDTEHTSEIERLMRDAQVTAREFRDALNANPVNQDAILAAGQRLRSMRDATLDHVVKMVAAERALLTADQWNSLQSALQERRQQRQQDRGFGGRGGRGGFGGGMGGRRPGGF